MKKVFFSIAVFSLYAVGCGSHRSKSQPEQLETDRQSFIPSDSTLPLPTFFSELFQSYQGDLDKYWADSFARLSESQWLDKQSAENLNTYLEITFFHQLFTSKSARNGIKGGILQIPYLWHWVTPNPRHEIIYLPLQEPLKDQQPTKRFSRYQSMADVDRTPSLFLQDLISVEPPYSHPACGEFYSFGWCSEREMAFVQLMSNYGYLGKVVTSGNHSWTSLLVSMKEQDGQEVQMEVRVDNTFDQLYWNRAPEGLSTEEWLNDHGEEGQIANLV
ncbi:MAG: hypothetical protein AAF399_17065 [Bacteroidota bacterium]